MPVSVGRMWPDELRVQWTVPVFGDGFLNTHAENGFLRVGMEPKMDRYIFGDSWMRVGTLSVWLAASIGTRRCQNLFPVIRESH